MKAIGIYEDRRKRRPWVVRWFGLPDLKTGKRKRYSKSFSTYDQAEKFKLEQALAFNSGRPRDRADEVTLQEFCSDWLRNKRRSIKPKTFRDYKRYVNRLIDYFGPDFLLREIGPYAANKFYVELQSEAGGILSDWSRNTILRYCRAIFSDAVVWGLIQSNPFSKVKGCRQPMRPWHYLTADQYRKLIKRAPSERWKALYGLAYTAGLRFGELFSLRWSDIDFENATVKIRNHPATSILPPFETKSGKERTVPLPEHTIEFLRAWKMQQGRSLLPYVLLTKRQYDNVLTRWKNYKAKGRAWENQDFVNNINREFKRHVRLAGIKPEGTLTLHTLRKCASKNWADRISNPRIVQELMGHASLSTTMRYYNKVNKNDMQKAASSIDAMLKVDANVTPDAASA